MLLEGSCHCGKVRFSLQSEEPWPYQRCYCSICRKTGSGGFMINLGGDMRTMQIEGKEHLSHYRAVLERDGERSQSRHHRYFCKECGCHLYAWSERWPDLVHPVASCIDTPLPEPPRHVHMMIGSKASWVPVQVDPTDEQYDDYPEKSLARWHSDAGYTE
ncbi:MAG: GFA family protein [Myxococcota bacterium]